MSTMTVDALKETVERTYRERKDFLVQPTKTVFDVQDVPVGPEAGNLRRDLRVQFNGQSPRVLTKHAESQLAEKLGIPTLYFKRMKEDAPDLLISSINTWATEQEPWMLRMLGDRCRAVLSRKFRRIDNFDMMHSVMPLIMNLGGMQVWRCQLTERRMYVHFATPRLQGEIRRGEIVYGGFVMSNSEIGERQMLFQYMLGTLACTNGAICETVLGRSHIGVDLSKQLQELGEIQLSEGTTLLEDAALMSKVRDALTSMLQAEPFQRILLLARNAEGRRFPPGEFAKAIDHVAEVTELSDGESSLLHSHLMSDGGTTPSAWRIVNAVTSLAHEVEGDRAVELEELGGRLLAEASNPASKYWLQN